MFRLILIAALFFLYNKTCAQFSVIGVEGSNILYAGVDNKVSIVVENTSCNSLVIKTTNGEIIGANCQYTYSINFDSVQKNNITSTGIEIYKKTSKRLELLSRKMFFIKQIPDPHVCILLCNSSTISLSYFRKNMSNDGHPKPPNIRAEISFFDFGLPTNSRFIIDSFYCSVFREGTCIIKPLLNKGNNFTDDTFEEFKKIKEKDTIVFDKIYAKGNDGSNRILKSVTILVTE